MKLLALALIAWGVFWMAGTAEAKRPLFGFNDDGTTWAAVADEAADLGANVARVPVGWSTPPENFDALNARLRSEGIRPLISLWGCEYPDLDAYAAQAAAFAQRFPGAIIQLWNEPNHLFFGLMESYEAAAIVRSGAKAIRRVKPRTTVLGPALAPNHEWEGSYALYYNGIYRRVPARLRVQPAVHIFPYRENPMRVVREAYRRAHRWGKVWVTELGFFRNSYGAEQAALSAEAYSLLSRKGARAIIFHRLLPQGGAARATGNCGMGPSSYPGAPPSGWEEAAGMSVLDNPPLATALKDARKKDKKKKKGRD